MVASLREEIRLYAKEQLVIVVFAITVAIALSLYARRVNAPWPSILQVTVLVSATFAIARTDLLMHRAGAYIARVEQTAQATPDGGGWERFKSDHPATRLLPAYDALSLLIVVVLLIDGERRAWRGLPERRRQALLVGTLVLFAVGVAAAPLAVYVSRPFR
jgi:hypothetical protein